MKNLKTKTRTILIATIVAAICSSFFVTNISYAHSTGVDHSHPTDTATPAPVAPKKAPAKKKKPAATTPAPAASGIDAEAKKAADLEQACTKDGKYSSCAEKKYKEAAATNNDDLTNGTFSVTKNLTLDDEEQAKTYFDTSSGQSPIVSLVMTFIDFAITIMGAIAVILFIVAGFRFMAANGNQTELDEAKDIIKYAAKGLIVALLAYVITIFVQSIFSNG